MSSLFRTLLLLFLVPLEAFAQGIKPGLPASRWGLTFGTRAAQDPYSLDGGYKYDLLPQVYYEKGEFYLHGLNAGYRFFTKENYDLRLVSYYRFYDVPPSNKAYLRDDGLDSGAEYVWHPEPNTDISLALLSDPDGRVSSALAFEVYHEIGPLELAPYIWANFKSARYNNRYYGLNEAKPGADVDVTCGGDVRLQVYKNFYLVANGEITMLGNKTVEASTVHQPLQKKYTLGAGIFQDKHEKSTFFDDYFVRVGYGWATISDRSAILFRAKVIKDENYNRMSSVFAGFLATDKLFTLPISLYFTPGIAYHLPSVAQKGPFPEFVLALKAMYTVPVPWRIRVGTGEGLSYTTKITNIEERDLDARGVDASNLLNYLDDSVDLSIRDIVNTFVPKAMTRELWVGWYLHHRSGIFSTSSLFGKVRGGSNYNMVYLQYDF